MIEFNKITCNSYIDIINCNTFIRIFREIFGYNDKNKNDNNNNKIECEEYEFYEK